MNGEHDCHIDNACTTANYVMSDTIFTQCFPERESLYNDTVTYPIDE